MRARLRSVLWLVVCLLLTACADPEIGALERELTALRGNPGEMSLPPLLPLPEVGVVTYDQADSRSPFLPERPEAEAEPAGSSDLAPDLSRPPEPLEAFVLESLELVGTLNVGGRQSALVRAPNGQVHRLTIGDHMGTDFGRIVSITPSSIQLVEVVATGQGGWLERSRQLTLDEQSDRRG